jgi:hypothetical protein
MYYIMCPNNDVEQVYKEILQRTQKIRKSKNQIT